MVKVRCKTCDKWIDEIYVEFLNVEEDFSGRDLLTFVCPKCKTKQKSIRVG